MSSSGHVFALTSPQQALALTSSSKFILAYGVIGAKGTIKNPKVGRVLARAAALAAKVQDDSLPASQRKLGKEKATQLIIELNHAINDALTTSTKAELNEISNDPGMQEAYRFAKLFELQANL